MDDEGVMRGRDEANVFQIMQCMSTDSEDWA